jgi:hypothetical protein
MKRCDALRNLGKIDRLALLTRERPTLPVDINYRTEMLHQTRRRIPTQVLVVDRYDAVRILVEALLQGAGYDSGFRVVLAPGAEATVRGEDHF